MPFEAGKEGLVPETRPPQGVRVGALYSVTCALNGSCEV